MLESIAILGYLGPETMLPATSAVAALAGLAMMFGRNSARWALGLVRAVAGRPAPSPAPSRPHRRIAPRPVGGIARGEATGAEVGG